MKIDPAQHRREHYAMQIAIPTRWNDYDLLGHVNNVLYNRYFEITVLELVKRAGVDWMADPVVPFAAEVCVKFLRPLTFSEHIDTTLRISRLGTSSVVYDVAIFMPNDDLPYAVGHFVHVFVDRGTEQPVSIPPTVRKVYEQYQSSNSKDQSDT